MDLTEKVIAANKKAWDEYPNPITHHNLPMVRQDAARAAIAVCAEEMARRIETQLDYRDPDDKDMQAHYERQRPIMEFYAGFVRSMGEKGE